MSGLLTILKAPSAAVSTSITALQIHLDFSASWVGVYEVWIRDKDSNEVFNGVLTAVGESVTSFVGLNDGEYTSDSDYGVDNTSSYMTNGAPTSPTVTNSSGGTPEWKVTNPDGMKIFAKFASEFDLVGGGEIIMALRNNYGDVVSTVKFYDQNGVEIVPTVSPADMSDGLQSTATTQMTVYTWGF